MHSIALSYFPSLFSLENSCDQNNGDCGYLCVNLPFRKRSKCMCPKDMNLQGDGKTCKRSQIIRQDGKCFS